MAFNWLKNRNPIHRYHRHMIANFGMDSSLALGWREPGDQVLRFEILAEIGDLNGCTVLDAGCGYADLYPFLKQRYPDLRHYYGVEQIPELLKRADEQVGVFPDVTLLKGDFLHTKLPVCDYVFASGSLNYGQDIFQAITVLYQSCTKGFGLNLLREVRGKGILHAYNPQEVISILQEMRAEVVLRDDYAQEDFTLYAYRR